jgi:hypothetical protein
MDVDMLLRRKRFKQRLTTASAIGSTYPYMIPCTTVTSGGDNLSSIQPGGNHQIKQLLPVEWLPVAASKGQLALQCYQCSALHQSMP